MKSTAEQPRVLRHESTIRRAVWHPLIAVGCLVIFLAGLAFYFHETALQVRHSSDRLYLASRSLRLALEMESSKRGYLLNGDEAYLTVYAEASRAIESEKPMEKLVVLTAGDNSQQQQAKSLLSEFVRWRADSDQQLSRARSATPFDIRQDLALQERKHRMDRIRAIQNRFLAEELRTKADRVRVSDYVARVALFGGSALTLLVGGFLSLTTRRQMREVADQYETVLGAEERVRERLATTLTSIGDGVIVTDAVGRITLLNPVAETLTGWGNTDSQGKPHHEILDIVHEKTGEKIPSPIDRAIQENRTILLANHTVLKRRDGTQIAIEDSASPIRDKTGKISGVVLVFRDVTARKEQETVLALALDKNTRIAETLQRSMLITPQQNSFPGMSVAMVYAPALDEAKVGGDFFDAFSFWDNQVALVVGDATGKGLSAAATISEVKYALRAYLHDDPDPAGALTRLNRFLCDSRSGQDFSQGEYVSPSFISIAVAVINRTTGEGTCAVAGSDPPLLIHNDGSTREAGESGVMLGASADSRYAGGTFLLNRGDLIAFTTDGITEARRGRSEFFGYDGFTRVLRESLRKESITLEKVAAHILAEAEAFSGGTLKDDVCLLLARRD